MGHSLTHHQTTFPSQSMNTMEIANMVLVTTAYPRRCRRSLEMAQESQLLKFSVIQVSGHFVFRFYQEPIVLWGTEIISGHQKKMCCTSSKVLTLNIALAQKLNYCNLILLNVHIDLSYYKLVDAKCPHQNVVIQCRFRASFFSSGYSFL